MTDLHQQICKYNSALPEAGKSAAVKCDDRIPIFPLRYSVHPRQTNSRLVTQYEQAGLPLETGFQQLESMQYGLRFIGGGFIYLFDETKKDFFVWIVEESGRFTELSSLNRTIGAALENYKTGNTLSWLWAREGSTVHIMPTDTLLTADKILEIQANKGGIRDKLATTVIVPTWSAESPSKNTFPVAKMAEVVDEYVLGNKALNFSPWQLKSAPHPAETLAEQMKKNAPQKQIAVVLYDNIALVQDMVGLIVLAHEDLERYVRDPAPGDAQMMQRYRKRVIIDYIDNVVRNVDKDDKKLGKRYLSHVDSNKKKEFLNSYNSNIKTRQTLMLRYGNDRALWLGGYAKKDNPKQLGSSFLRYDTGAVPTGKSQQNTKTQRDKSTSRCAHANAFASITEGMIWGTSQLPEGMKDEGARLYEKWWTGSSADNPILENISYDDGMVELWKASGTGEAMGTAIGGTNVVSVWLRHVAVQRIMEQTEVYILSRISRLGGQRTLRGAAWNSVAEYIAGMADGISLENAQALVNRLETVHGDRIVMRQLTEAEAIDFLFDGANMRPTPDMLRGATAPGARPPGQTITVFHWERFTEESRNPLFPRFEGGMAAVVGFLAIINLGSAMRNFDKDNIWVSTANVISAIMGVGSGINMALASTAALTPRWYARVSTSRGIRWTAGVGGMRFFGYVGAFADAFIHWLSAYHQFNVGNFEAGSYYAFAGFAAGASGAALTTASVIAATSTAAGSIAVVPVVGWTVAGLLLLGLGVWLTVKGAKAEYDDMDFWINDCAFGKRERLGRPVIARYETLTDEIYAFLSAAYGPKLVEKEWNHKKQAVQVRLAYVLDGKISKPEQSSSRCWIVEVEKTENGIRYREYAVYDLSAYFKENPKKKFVLTFTYAPEGMEQTLAFRVEITEDDMPFYL
jgi:hypothetical protein